MAESSERASAIPADVQRFILTSIESVAEVEALLLLRGTPERAWSARALAPRLYIDESQAGDILKQLADRRFLVRDTEHEPTYRYDPSAADLRSLIDRLAQFYSTHLIGITNLIHLKSKSRVQEFANAFRIRKDD